MAEQPSLHIDTDWKKQAQEEKRKLAEQEQKRTAETAGPSLTGPGGGSGKPGAASGGKRGARELPVASFTTMIQSFVTQALYYLGGLAVQGTEPTVNLDMAKLQLDTLTLLEEKTKNNLTPVEQKMLDQALYEVQMRYVGIASEYI
jgi:uncharacterized protein DUF1844